MSEALADVLPHIPLQAGSRGVTSVLRPTECPFPVDYAQDAVRVGNPLGTHTSSEVPEGPPVLLDRPTVWGRPPLVRVTESVFGRVRVLV